MREGVCVCECARVRGCFCEKECVWGRVCVYVSVEESVCECVCARGVYECVYVRGCLCERECERVEDCVCV